MCVQCLGKRGNCVHCAVVGYIAGWTVSCWKRSLSFVTDPKCVWDPSSAEGCVCVYFVSTLSIVCHELTLHDAWQIRTLQGGFVCFDPGL